MMTAMKTRLLLGTSRLERIPSEVGNLVEMKSWVDLSEMRVSEIPTQIGFLSALTGFLQFKSNTLLTAPIPTQIGT